MAAPRSLRRWRLAALVAAVLALLGLALAWFATPGEAPETTATGAPSRDRADAATCEIPPLTSVRALPEADGPPVLLWATGEVRLYLDDKAAFSSPEAPRHFAVGEHTVRVEVAGHPPYALRIRFEPWTPALLHAELDPEAGLTLVRLQAPCVSCPEVIQPYETVGLREQRTEAPLAEAAAALRGNDWLRALTFLEQVPTAQRGTRAFHRLESAVYTDTYSSAAAHSALAMIDDAELRTLLVAHRALDAAERTRQREVQLARWNRTTERFAAVVEGWGKVLPHAMGSASERFEALSPIFERAHAARELLDAEEALQAAETELLTLTNRLRAARPGDCAFQAEIVRAVTR